MVCHWNHCFQARVVILQELKIFTISVKPQQNLCLGTPIPQQKTSCRCVHWILELLSLRLFPVHTMIYKNQDNVITLPWTSGIFDLFQLLSWISLWASEQCFLFRQQWGTYYFENAAWGLLLLTRLVSREYSRQLISLTDLVIILPKLKPASAVFALLLLKEGRDCSESF